MRHRIFVDHGGQVHIVRISDEEMAEKLRYRAGVLAVSLLFAAVTVIASGILW